MPGNRQKKPSERCRRTAHCRLPTGKHKRVQEHTGISKKLAAGAYWGLLMQEKVTCEEKGLSETILMNVF